MLTRQQLIEFLSRRPRRVHFVGIGGVGMSGLARILAQQGHTVSGSDVALNGMVEGLEQLGVALHRGHAALNVPAATELLVYTTAVNGDNPEVRAAAARQIPVARRGALLSALMTRHCNIAVAGTHGKTTTTAMLASVLGQAGRGPGFCIGALVPGLGTNADCGTGAEFVAEACESDGTLTGFSPEIAVCLNIEAEHLDHHKTMDALRATFAELFAQTRDAVVFCADCPQTARLAPATGVSFGLSEHADYRAADIATTARGSRFTVIRHGARLGEIELSIPGRQNVVNALAAVAVADRLGVALADIAAGLHRFTGAQRRFERHYDRKGVVVVDDYAHHPTEIKATIAAARTLGFQRIVLAFQPHRYTRTQALLAEFATAFAGVDELYFADIYAASEPPIPGITGRTIPDAIPGAVFEPDFDKLVVRLVSAVQPGTLTMTMGAGDIYKVAHRVAAALPRPGRNIEQELRAELSSQSVVRANEPMARHTSLRVGGPAEFWVEPADEQDLVAVLRFCRGHGLPVTVIGRGTNLLVRDGGLPGVVLHMGGAAFAQVAVDGVRITAGCGARLKAVVTAARQHELGGLEFLEGIPGSIGGALRMNAGAMGRQMFDVVERVRYVSLAGEVFDAAANSLPVKYRCCPVFQDHIALAAVVRGEPTPRAAIDEKLTAFSQKRWASQPAKPSAGCIFKNPAAIPAGRLIDELGLKGAAVGGARVSDVHANFIVNEGGATAGDVLRLIEVVRDKARLERGIELEPEVLIVGNA